MSKRTAMLLCLLIALTIPAAAAQNSAFQPSPAGGSTLSVRPAALGPLVENQNIKMMLKNGTYAEGKVLEATEDTLTLNIKHSEPKGQLKKGDAPIRIRDISVVYLRKKGPIALPILLGVAGGIGGFVAGAYTGYVMDSPAAFFGMGIGFASAGAVGGAYLGTAASRRTVIINITDPKSGYGTAEAH